MEGGERVLGETTGIGGGAFREQDRKILIINSLESTRIILVGTPSNVCVLIIIFFTITLLLLQDFETQ